MNSTSGGLSVAYDTSAVTGPTANQPNKVSPEPFNEVRLVEYIMDGYNTFARPVKNITSTTTLEISLYVIQILKLVIF